MNGQGAYVRVPDTAGLEQVTTNVSVSVWLNLSTNVTYTAGDIRSVVRKVVNENNAAPYSSYDLVVQTAGTTFQARFGITTSGSTRTTVMSATHPYGGWYHLVGVYDGTTLHVFVNGVEEANTPVTGALLSTAGEALCIGDYGAENSVPGLVDEVRLYIARARRLGRSVAFQSCGSATAFRL